MVPHIGGERPTHVRLLSRQTNDQRSQGPHRSEHTIPGMPNDTRHRPTQTMNDPSQPKLHKTSFDERHRAASHERPNAGQTTHDVVPWATQVRPSDTGRRPINDPMQAKRHKTSSHERPKSGQATQGAVP